jgi:signal transduction histidine kinase/ligand-binding sensor domain-containing protein
MRRTLQFAMALWCAFVSGAAERIAHWRTFPAGEAPIVSVTLGPRGRVLASQSDGAAITILDGYANRQVALPPDVARPIRVYESRTGQLWTTYSDGLLMYKSGQWTRHFINDIRLEPLKPFHPIPIVPAEVNRALFLLPSRLMDFDASIPRVSTIKYAADTKLGPLFEMSETSDGGLLVSGANGIARIGGPLRQVGPNSSWQECVLPPGSLVENLQRPMEGREGAALIVGFDRNNTPSRHILTSVGTNWISVEIATEKFRAAWHGWGDTLWAVSYNGLFRHTGQGPNSWVREGGADTYYDVAVQTNGVFWLATSAGLVRYAPLLWQAPSEISEARLAESACYAITQGETALWLATIEGLVRVADSTVDRIPWPDDFEPTLAGIESLYEIPSGGVLIGATHDTFVFDPKTRSFTKLIRDATARALGKLSDGSACVRVVKDGATRIDKFDGKRLETLWPSIAEIGITNEVFSVLQSRGGDFWIGGAFGVARYHPGDPRAQIFAGAEGLLPERIQVVAEVGEDKIWAGGTDSIFEFRSGRWERVRAGVERVRTIVRARDGTIWAAASDGIHQFKDGVWLGHGDEEGLPSTVTQGLAIDRRGRPWAATTRGPVVYYPDADTDEPRTFPATVIENESEEARGVTLRLNGVDKWNYTSPTRLLYAYRLDEGAWSQFTNVSTVSFQNLSGGPHYLQVRAMDRNGNQDLSVATHEFAVAVPWSRDPRLLGVAILGLIAVIFFAGLAVNRHLQLKRSYAEVERIVAERTAQLEKANQELLHSQKMRALGTLAAGIAHDFNNILSIIKGSAQIIESNPTDQLKVLTRIDRIKTVVEQGAGIVRSMLGMGKVSDFTECDPAELVEESIRLLGDRFPPQLHVKYEKDGAPPRLNCSKGVIHQILLNLILNAVDASGGEGTVILRTRVVTDPGAVVALPPAPAEAYLAIDVADKGVGIAPESLPRIFEPFYTTKGFSSRRGTGLGLSMVYELAKGLGYGLAVRSKVGEGSTFTLLAPLS